MFELQRAHRALPKLRSLTLDLTLELRDKNIRRGFVPAVVRSRLEFQDMTILIEQALGEAVDSSRRRIGESGTSGRTGARQTGGSFHCSPGDTNAR